MAAAKKKQASVEVSSMQKAHAARAARIAQGLKATRNPIEIFQDKPTRGTAIRAKCYDCVGGSCDAIPGYREKIRTCASTRCPLHQFRPYQNTKSKRKDVEEDDDDDDGDEE